MWKSKPQKKPQFAYSNLTSDVLFNYIMHRVGNDFDDFISNFYQKKIRIAHPVYLWMNPLSPRSIPNTTENRILQGAGQYGISATRYDFLRIAKAMMDDWKNQTCEGTYLREIYDNSVRTNKRDTWNMTLADKGRMLGFQRVAKGYAGQFWVNIQSMDDDVVFVMSGADGQQIAINMSKSRIVAFAAGQEEFYDTKTLGMETLKFGRIKSSR